MTGQELHTFVVTLAKPVPVNDLQAATFGALVRAGTHREVRSGTSRHSITPRRWLLPTTDWFLAVDRDGAAFIESHPRGVGAWVDIASSRPGDLLIRMVTPHRHKMAVGEVQLISGRQPMPGRRLEIVLFTIVAHTHEPRLHFDGTRIPR